MKLNNTLHLGRQITFGAVFLHGFNYALFMMATLCNTFTLYVLKKYTKIVTVMTDNIMSDSHPGEI